MRKVKAGIIGCGGFGNFHLDNLLKMEDVEVVALASRNERKLAETGRKAAGARLYSSHINLFSSEKDLDAVFICVPPDSHQDIELRAAEKGIHFYVEKPIALSLPYAFHVREAVRQSGIIASVGYQERYNEAIDDVKAFVAVQKAGLVTCRWLGGLPGLAWWQQKTRSGGQLVEQCTHLFDLLRYLFGEAQTVYCRSVKGILNVPGCDIEDASVTVVSFLSGVAASVQAGCYFRQGVIQNGIGMQIFCQDAVVEYDWMKEVRYISGGGLKKITCPADSHLHAARAFIQAVETGRRDLVRSPYSDAVETLALTLAANESMLSGLPVIMC